jgi:hypothetical protein
MSLSYDQYSFVRMVFEEAYIPAVYRRRAERISQRVDLELQRWHGGTAGDPLTVHIVDYSATGFGINHSESMKIGAPFVLPLPRPGDTPLALVLHVVRCTRSEDQSFEIGMEYDSVLDSSGTCIWGSQGRGGSKVRKNQRTPLRRKILFFLFGVVGILIGTMI